MMYQERYSAIRKIISDSIFLLLLFVLVLSGSIMTWNGDTIGKPPEMVRIFLSIAFFLFALLLLYFFIQKITGIKKNRSNWIIELDSEFVRLVTPDDEEVEPFEYEHTKINKLSCEAYDDDGISYKWFIYIKNGSGEIKKGFDLGPFSEDKIAGKIKNRLDIEVIEVDIKGVTRDWDYSLWFKIKALFSSLFGALIFASFLVPGFFYLAKIIKNYVY